MSLRLLPFQKRFVRAVESDQYLTCALSGPRGLGKTTLAGWLCARALTPGDTLYAGDGKEVVLFSGSIEQCRLVYRAALSFLEESIDDYRTVDSATRVGITHKQTRVRLKAIGSNPKTSLGLVGTPLVVLDEPAALHATGGAALWDSIVTAQGKPGSRLKCVAIGTLAPADPESWWPQLIERGSSGTTHVELLQARRDRALTWREALRVNPLARTHPEQTAKLKEELAEAKTDTRLAARWMSYRMNIPTRDESVVLLTVDDWQRVLARPVPPRVGRPIVAYDLGGGRSFSAACALFENGRLEALAVAPGIPTLEEQEQRDRVPAGTYRRLAEKGALRVAEGLRVQPPGDLHRAALVAWGRPTVITCDRFRLPELADVVGGLPLLPRVARWSEASEDIRALRKMAMDGPMACEENSRALLTASLAVAKVRSDDQGSTRMVKSSNNTARDDCAAALCLAAGSWMRQTRRPRRPMRSMIVDVAA